MRGSEEGKGLSNLSILNKKERVSLEVKRKKSENDRAFIFEYI